MRLRSASSAPPPACLRRPRCSAGCGSGDSDRRPRGERRKPPGAAEERVPARPKGRSLRRSARRRPKPDRTGRLAGGDGLLQGREPLPLRRLPQGPHPVDDAEVALYFARCPKCTREAEKRKPRAPRRRREIKALEEPAIGPFPARDRKPRDQARLPGGDDQRRPERRDRRLLDRGRLSRATASGGSPRVIKEGDQLSATLLPSVDRRRVPPRMPQVGRQGAADPHADRRTTSAATSRRSRRGSRRTPRTRSTTPTRSARNRSSSCLRPPSSARVGSAAPSSTWPSRSNSEYGDKAAFIHMEIYKDNDPAKGADRRCGPSTCPASRGCSRSTATGRSATSIEGAFGVDALTEAVEKVTSE